EQWRRKKCDRRKRWQSRKTISKSEIHATSIVPWQFLRIGEMVDRSAQVVTAVHIGCPVISMFKLRELTFAGDFRQDAPHGVVLSCRHDETKRSDCALDLLVRSVGDSRSWPATSTGYENRFCLHASSGPGGFGADRRKVYVSGCGKEIGS